MQRSVLPVVTALLATALPAHAADTAAMAAEARTVVKSFASELKGELVAALESGGPVEAIAVCNERAPALAAAAAERSGWRVGRTSLKLRNPDNAPDAWESAVLRNFDARAAGGESPKKIEFSAVVDQQGQRTFRYMKAIPTAEKPCLACHGKAITPQVLEQLDSRYPDDRARGYGAGEIRGAFTLSKTLP
jgi:hypothetical protein